MNYKKLKLISVVTLLMMPMIVLADGGESFIPVAIGIEAFVTIHMSLFVLMPLSKILKYDLTEQKRLFWKMFWIRCTPATFILEIDAQNLRLGRRSCFISQQCSCRSNPGYRRWEYPCRRNRRSGRTESRSGRSGGGG